MELYSRNQVQGSDVRLKTTSDLHFNNSGNISKKEGPENGSDPFSKVLLNAVDEVNQLQQTSDSMEEKMVLNPEAVDIHEVMIASEKARLSVTYLKSITEKAIRAYNEIMMIR